MRGSHVDPQGQSIPAKALKGLCADERGGGRLGHRGRAGWWVAGEHTGSMDAQLQLQSMRSDLLLVGPGISSFENGPQVTLICSQGCEPLMWGHVGSRGARRGEALGFIVRWEVTDLCFPRLREGP